MKITAFIAAVGVCLVMTVAGQSNNQMIPFDHVKNFAQQDPKSISEKAALLFRPQLSIGDSSCYPYPAVNRLGQISAGMKTGYENCRPNGDYESQVYSRVTWHHGFWCMMYAYYFPDVRRFHHVVLWLNNPDTVPDRKILGVSVWNYNHYDSKAPPDPKTVKDLSVKIIYDHDTFATTEKEGKFHPLIMWDQMTVNAQNALNPDKGFNGNPVPFNKGNFISNLKMAYTSFMDSRRLV